MITQASASEIPTAPPETSQDKFFEATTMWEQFNIEPTNRWIQLDGEGGNDDIKIIKIGHGTPGAADETKTATALEMIEELPEGIEEEPVQLESGDIIKVATLTHDAAGHVTTNNNPNYTYYKLPTTQLIVVLPEGSDEDSPESITPNDDDILQTKGDGQWIALTNDENTLKIAHTTIASEEDITTTDLTSLNCLSPAENLTVNEYIDMMETEGKTDDEINIMANTLNSLSDIQIIALEGGDLITARQSEIDTNGHIIKNTPIYYKLPVTPSQISFDVHESRLSDLEARLTNGQLDNGIAYETYEDIVKKVYEAGELRDMHSKPSHQNITITQTIGNIDGDENSVTSAMNQLTNLERDTYNISEAIQLLVKQLQEKNDAIITLNNAISGLDARIKALEQ